MIPVYQTTFGEVGNCLAACIASILEMPLADVPVHLTEDWFESYNDWLEPRGLEIDHWPLKSEPAEYHIMSGMSPRGRRHAVVAKGSEIVHDPHPDNTGLVSRDYLMRLTPIKTPKETHHA